MSDSPEPWMKAQLDLMAHILEIQRDMNALKAEIETLKAQANRPSLLISILETSKVVLVTKEGQALLALTIAGLAALGKLLFGGS